MTPFDVMRWARAQKTGAAARKAVLTALAEHADAQGRCYPSHALLAAETDQCERSVRRHLEALREAGLVTWTRSYATSTGGSLGRGRARNTYTLAIPADDQADTLTVSSSTNRTACLDQPDTSVRGSTIEDAAAARVSSTGGDGRLVDDGALHPIVDACQRAARVTAEKERARGKRITSLARYSAPRARDYRARYEAELDRAYDGGASIDAMVALIVEAESDPFGIGHTLRSVEPARPRLAEFRQQALDETDAWRAQQPVVLAEVAAGRRALRAARERTGT